MIHSPSLVMRRLRCAALGSNGAGLLDGQLLRAFLNNHDEGAFEALVRRHGPMVLGVCRRVLGNAHDAEDAFQAAFLVLVRKAADLAGRELVGDWLHGVAYRTALKARTQQARRRGKERRMARPEAIEADPAPDWQALFDTELHGLPEKYRAPIILCELEGRTHQEAARQLGCPVGTLSGRLSRARSLLARRLKHRGLTLSAAAVSAMLASQVSAAAISPSLVSSTVKAATLVATGQAAAGVLLAPVASLTEGVVRSMLFAKWKRLGLVVLAIVVLCVGTGALRPTAAADEKDASGGQTHSTSGKPVPRLSPDIPPQEFEVALEIAERKKGEAKPQSKPDKPHFRVLAGTRASYFQGGSQPIKLHDKVQTINSGITVQVMVCCDDAGRLDFDISVSRDSVALMPGNRGARVDSELARLVEEIELDKPIHLELKSTKLDGITVEVTATVNRARALRNMDMAEEDISNAESNHRAGKRDEALRLYRLILHRYPDTLYAKTAARMIEVLSDPQIPLLPPLPKGAYRVGEIRLVNKTKTKDSAIRENLQLYQGSAFTTAQLRKAEEAVLKRVRFAAPVKVTIAYEDIDSEFKNIVVTIEEQKSD